jgi:hypothetical protein
VPRATRLAASCAALQGRLDCFFLEANRYAFAPQFAKKNKSPLLAATALHRGAPMTPTGGGTGVGAAATCATPLGGLGVPPEPPPIHPIRGGRAAGSTQARSHFSHRLKGDLRCVMSLPPIYSA